MFIRAAQAADAPAMGRVMVDTYLRAHQGQVPDEAWHRRQEEWTPEVSAANWARAMSTMAEDSHAHECLYIAVENATQPEQVIGLIMGGPSAVAGYEGVGDIYALYVDFAYQRRGIGRKLVQAAARHLHHLGMTALIIRCLSTNAPGNRFYSALGGQLVGEGEVDEYGYRIPECIYYWADSAVLLGDGGSNGASNPRPIGETPDAG